MQSSHSLIASACLAAFLAGCASVPGSGPRTVDIERGGNGPYTLVDLNANAARTITRHVSEERKQPPIALPPGRPLGFVGPGDMLQVTIWEPNPNGTTLTSDRANVQANMRVGPDGSIGVPYVGRLTAAGRTPAQIEALILGRLSTQIQGAQVAVVVTEDLTNAIIVQGDVARPGRYQVVPRSSGLLDILALAGGPATANRQTLVRITRGDTAVTHTLSSMVDARQMEADLAPGDRILVQPRRSYFYAFGAVANPGEQPYDADNISLARTLARLNGLTDNRADPAQVFVFRHQDAALTQEVTQAGPRAGQDPTSVIYRLNLRDPGGFFISRMFPVLPDDIVYVSESPISEAAKVFQVINGVAGVGSVPRNLGAPY